MSPLNGDGVMVAVAVGHNQKWPHRHMFVGGGGATAAGLLLNRCCISFHFGQLYNLLANALNNCLLYICIE